MTETTTAVQQCAEDRRKDAALEWHRVTLLYQSPGRAGPGRAALRAGAPRRVLGNE